MIKFTELESHTHTTPNLDPYCRFFCFADKTFRRKRMNEKQRKWTGDLIYVNTGTCSKQGLPSLRS